MKDGVSGRADGLIGSVRETADALGRLTVEHLRLARLEMRSDLRAMGQHAAALAVLVALAVVGYGLAMAGFALLLGGSTATGVPLLIIGAAHLATAGAILAMLVAGTFRAASLAAPAGRLVEAPAR